MTDSTPLVSTDDRPALLLDRGFWGLNLTQFLGAFNDNLFKQLVLLMCLDQRAKGEQDLQGHALILFSLPFIGLSGYAGFLSDRYSKRTIIILCKLAEILIVVLGMVGFAMNQLPFLLAVLFLMGIHSAFFGPSKYGILPEMLRPQDLPRANGIILMATFLAIIFGLSAAGEAKQQFSTSLWIASLPCLVIAVSGLISSLMIRSTPVAQPDLKFELSAVAMAPDTRQMLRSNRTLFGVLVMSSVFWLVGGTIYPPAINALCKEQFHFEDRLTGMLAASTGVGIAFGCILAGVLSKDRVRGWIVRLGAWGLTFSLLLLSIPGPGWNAVRSEIAVKKAEIELKKQADKIKATNEKAGKEIADEVVEQPEVAQSDPGAGHNEVVTDGVDPFYRGTLLGPYGSAVALIAVGLFAGLYSVPLQVYLQANSPTEQKGRIIGAMNLLNWIGIAAAGVIYWVGRSILVDRLMYPQATLFAFAALLMLPVALLYRPPDGQAEST